MYPEKVHIFLSNRPPAWKNRWCRKRIPPVIKTFPLDRVYAKEYIRSQQAKDFLERNIDEIARELILNEVTEEDFHDLFQEECERYSEYLECE